MVASATTSRASAPDAQRARACLPSMYQWAYGHPRRRTACAPSMYQWAYGHGLWRPPRSCCRAARPRRLEPACVIRDTGAKGMGVFAAEDIERGRWVCQYIGTLVSDGDESDESNTSREPPWDPLGLMPTPESTSGLPRVDPGSDYVLALCPGLCLDARHSNHFSRYINHDEHGNLQCSVSVDERRADFFAAATIRRGTLLNTHAPWEPP